MSSIKPKIGTCTVCNKTDKPLMKKMCCDGYMSCYEKQRWARYNEKKKAAPVKERKPIAKVSKKRTLELAKYEKAKAEFLKDAVCQFPGCNSKFVTLHHGGGRTGKRLYDRLLFRSLCWPHHQYCEEHPEEAKAMNLSVSRLETTAS